MRDEAEYIGYIDSVHGDLVRGWASSVNRRNDVLTVDVLLNGKVIGSARADLLREDLQHAGFGDGRHGFECRLPRPVAADDIEVRVSGSSYSLVNSFSRRQRISDKRHWERLHNSTIDGPPRPRVAFSRRSADQRDIQIATEIIDFWRRAVEPAAARGPRKGEMWDIHMDQSHRGLVDLLQAGDAAGLSRYLVDLPKQSATNGILQGDDAYNDLVSTTDEGRVGANFPAADMLVSLAQYLGVRRLESPEQGALGEVVKSDQERLRRDIENALDISLVRPAIYDGLVGLSFSDGVLDQRDIQAAYAAIRVRDILGSTTVSVCEIGGGLAQVAWYAWMLGIRHYTIVDLPTVRVMQYFCLRRALPDVAVRLLTDAEPIPSDEGINLVAAGGFDSRSGSRFDLVLNCDSFPEMGEEICASYLKAIRHQARFLLSINQEANEPLTSNPDGPRQPIVGVLVGRQPGFRPVYRMRTWVRKGYAEELWQID